MIDLCAKIDRLIFKNRKQILFDDFHYQIFENVKDVPVELWQKANEANHFFLSLEYLRVNESVFNDNGIRFKYVLIFKNEAPVLATVFQIVEFSASVFGSLIQEQLSSLQSNRMKLFEHYVDHKKNGILLKLITCGNNLISGQHAFVHHADLTTKLAFEIIQKLTLVITKTEKLRGKISAILVKDFEKSVYAEHSFGEKYNEVSVEPNMVIQLPNELSSINDYIQLFSKKYRNRSKTIFRKFEGLHKKELTSDEVELNKLAIFKLYEKVFNRAKFKLVKLNPEYFVEMKKAFPDQFFIRAYFKQDELVAFQSGFILENSIEAHYVGFDENYNEAHECYQNLLYDFINTAIINKKQTIQLGRTAAEIKSTVGAKPVDLVCYIKPQNSISKLVMKPFIRFLQPSEWVPRNPFKQD
jgi:hypothetical protein